jgi:general secretion pathway protein J
VIDRRKIRITIPGRTAAGMTLVEVMAALTVFAFVSTAVYSGFMQTMKIKQRVEQQMDRYHEVAAGLERMAREITMAYTSAQTVSNPDESLRVVKTCFVGSEGSGGGRLDFTSFSHLRLYRNAHESDQNELSYYVTGHPEDSSRNVVARREQRRIDDDPQKGGQSQILIDDVLELSFRYLDPLSGEWVTTWDADPEGTHPNRLPAQVEIKVTVPDPLGRGPDKTFGTRAVIPLRFALNHAIYNI